MKKSNKELSAAFLAILLITGFYLAVVYRAGSVPAAARSFMGHSLGVAGFTLMLMTEGLYSWRKRSRTARWGKMAAWLRFHIFTGIVGPYLVLLHSAWEFNGIAGIVLLLTGIVVLSGFIGRYIYTAIPRTADGIEIGQGELVTTLERIDQYIQQWTENHPGGQRLVTVFAGTGEGWLGRFRWYQLTRGVNLPSESLTQLYLAMTRKTTLRRQVKSLARARQLLGLWHIVHVPLGLALFTTALVHIGGAIYFATLLR